MSRLWDDLRGPCSLAWAHVQRGFVLSLLAPHGYGKSLAPGYIFLGVVTKNGSHVES